MNKIVRMIKVGLLIGCGLGANAAYAHSPAGQIYKVTVFTSFGTQFSSCFSFNNSGGLTVDGYGPLLYRRDKLNTQPELFQAIPSSSPPPAGFILSFHGNVSGGYGQIIGGDGVNQDGDTFIFQGVVTSSCPEAARTGTSPFKRR